MKFRVMILAFLMPLVVSCSSPLDILSSALGSKPDMTAQVGAENVKQGVGLSNKVDASNEAEATVKDSKVGSLDSSSGKKVTASSITADMIKADTIQISNNEPSNIWPWLAFVGLISISAGILIGRYFTKNKGA